MVRGLEYSFRTQQFVEKSSRFCWLARVLELDWFDLRREGAGDVDAKNIWIISSIALKMLQKYCSAKFWRKKKKSSFCYPSMAFHFIIHWSVKAIDLNSPPDEGDTEVLADLNEQLSPAVQEEDQNHGVQDDEHVGIGVQGGANHAVHPFDLNPDASEQQQEIHPGNPLDDMNISLYTWSVDLAVQTNCIDDLLDDLCLIELIILNIFLQSSASRKEFNLG